MEILDKLNLSIKESSELDRQLSRYLLDNQQVADKLKASNVASDNFVSNATVTKYVKRIGYDSFNHMKFMLYNAYIENKRMEANYTGYSGISYVEDIKQSIDMTLNGIDELALTKLCDKITKSDQILISAIAGTHVVAYDLELKLRKLNYNVTAPTDNYFRLFGAKHSTEDSLVIGISYSGQTEEVLKSLSIAKNHGAYTVLICGAGEYDFIDQHIYVKATESTKRKFSITSRASMTMIIDIIYLELLNLNFQENPLILSEDEIL